MGDVGGAIQMALVQIPPGADKQAIGNYPTRMLLSCSEDLVRFRPKWELEGIVNLFALMQYQDEREAVSPLLSFRRPKLES
jgi:hypothetical protein